MKNLILLIIPLVFLFSCQQEQATRPATINHRGQEVFLSGINLAWIEFADDLRNLNVAEFTRALDELSLAGGNTLRWWIHVNGAHSPEFTDDKVTGIHKDDLTLMKHALDLAWERGILVIPCLWSFDMLQPNAGEENWPRNKKLLEDLEYTQAYIKNALTPMVEYLKDHPAIVAWEVFNEPEGMNSDVEWAGWTPVQTQTIYIQRFINLVAGTIHRIDPNAKVTNGCWNFVVMTEINGMENHYTDQRLIAAGGDSLGTLDFYQIHFYPEHFDEQTSPFHHPVSHWELDKPILIGEFSAKGLDGKPAKSLTTLEAYQYAIDNGYAGALSWTWTNHDGHGGLPDAQEALIKLKHDYPDNITIRK